MARGTAPSPVPEGSTPMFVVTPDRASNNYKGGYSLTTQGEYDPGLTPEIDKAIRHMSQVVIYITKKAHELRRSAGDNFEVVVQNRPETQRPRAYVVPANGKGIHEELSQAVLLKAALGMTGR